MEVVDLEDNIMDSTASPNTSANSPSLTSPNMNSSKTSTSTTPKQKKKRKLTNEERAKIAAERELKRLEKERIEKEKREKRELAEKERLEKKEKLELEKAEKREKMELEKAERNKKMELEKAEKMKQKEEMSMEKKEKERLKEEERMKKQMERDAINALKREKEEEKRKKQEEKIKIEEKEKRELEKSKNLFNKFIKKEKKNESGNVTSNESQTNINTRFLPFQLSKDQTLAPAVKDWVKERFVLGAFDASLNAQDYGRDELYIALIRNRQHIPHRFIKVKEQQEIMIEEEADVQLENDQQQSGEAPLKKQFIKVKHLQFEENVRPPYHGTWSKRSRCIGGRNPFVKDVTFLDYEVDSDQEWEEGGDGESLNGSDNEDDDEKEKGDDYEIDNDFFVPHGHLSDDEQEDENSELAMTVDDDMASSDPKTRPLIKEAVLMAERNKAFEKNKVPKLVGCIWESKMDQTNKTNANALKLLEPFKRVFLSNK